VNGAVAAAMIGGPRGVVSRDGPAG
jgi:hypothetical protein